LIAAGVLLVLVVLAVATFSYLQGRERALSQAEENAEDLARALEQHTFVVVRGIDRALSVLPERIDLDALHRPDQRLFFHQLLDRWSRADPSMTMFNIADKHGIILHRSRTPVSEPIDISDRSFFIQHRENADAGLVIGEPVIARSGPNEGQPIMVFSRRLSAPDGSFAGVIVAIAPAATLREFYESLNVGRSGVVNLFRRDGVLLARSPSDADALGKRFDAMDLFSTHLPMAQHGTYRGRLEADDRSRIIAYRTIPQYPLVVMVSVAETEILAGWRQTAVIGATALLLLAAAVMLLMLWLSGALRREAASIRALAINEARARSTLETLSDGVITIDARGVVQSFNPAAERMFGYAAAEIVGGTADRMIGLGRLGELAGSLTGIDGQGNGAARREIEAMRSNGQLFPAELRFGVARGDSALGDLLIVTVRDLSDEKALQHQFEQSQKLEVIGHLTGGIAHDFGNVLAGITTNLETSLRQMPADAPARGQIDVALRAARGGREIVQRLMAFARKQPLNPCPSDINQLISSIMPLLRQGRGPGIEIETKLSSGLAPINIDRSGMENAILNLVINANDAMPAGGRIVLETGRVNISPMRAAQWGVKAGEYATLAVRDAGSGMTPEISRQIFEPFFSTKPAGTGLGLSMVQRFVAQSGGSVSVDTKPGAGTCITMYFPMLRGRQGTASDWFNQLAPSTLGPSRGRAILVVEDNKMVREGVTLLLQQLGHRPIAVPDAQQALARLDEDAGIELLLTDIGLPGMNGRQLARVARGRNPAIKVLFATGYDTMSGGERPLAEVDDNTGLLMKPFFEEDLTREIERLFRSEPARPNGEGRMTRAVNGGGR
jgi:PAS domain S-box-containing protein